MPTEQLQYWVPLLTDHSPYLFAIIDSQHRYVIVNQGYCNLSGLDRNDLVGRNDSEVLGASYYRSLEPYYQRAFQGELIETEVLLEDSHHETCVQFTLCPLKNNNDAISYVAVYSHDTSERQLLVNSLDEQESLFNKINELVDDGLCIISDMMITKANTACAQLLGFSKPHEIVGKPLDQLLCDDSNTPYHLQQIIWKKTLYPSKNSAIEQPVLASSTPITLVGSPAYLLKLEKPNTQPEQQEHIEQLIHTDPLTGLYNRHGFTRQLEQHIQQQIPLLMLYLDIDNFKNINDSLGHNIGDRVLQEIGNRLSHLLPKHAIIGHLGGDEFCVLLPQADSEFSGEQLCQNVINQINQPFDLHHFRKHLACSIGLVQYPGDGNDARILLQNADTAMYEAKHRGRNRFIKFDDAMNKEARMRLWLEIELQKALQNQGLEVWYQPKVNARDFAINGAEALVRWKHPVEGYISPAQFIPVAEESGLIEQLGRVVMREVFSTVKKWKDRGLMPGRVAINLSPQQFGNPSLIAFMKQLKFQTGINPDDITFELTESAVMSDSEHTISMLKAIKQLGFALSIDDFGTGYSSLSYLARFPLDELKIDRAFIKDIDEVPKQVTLIENIINLGKALNMSLVAEGVETREQAILLSNLNCDYIQGFHFYRPQPKQELEGVLLQNKHRSE
ncbi:c-di-GMP phosphodiesterase [Photobacterium damselae subsp. damselae]|uniref:sensor domain-containing protein n=1 Tax=Photobacterium damselae TaxID=38293 RepID=UPI000D05B0A7|nr:EAL domain-containing protein [Photobacterium damselae]PSB89010.1 c-di-GMP phosphodiesterase [Photobacterium damselae subsp. damselae]